MQRDKNFADRLVQVCFNDDTIPRVVAVLDEMDRQGITQSFIDYEKMKKVLKRMYEEKIISLNEYAYYCNKNNFIVVLAPQFIHAFMEHMYHNPDVTLENMESWFDQHYTIGYIWKEAAYRHFLNISGNCSKICKKFIAFIEEKGIVFGLSISLIEELTSAMKDAIKVETVRDYEIERWPEDSRKIFDEVDVSNIMQSFDVEMYYSQTFQAFFNDNVQLVKKVGFKYSDKEKLLTRACENFKAMMIEEALNVYGMKMLATVQAVNEAIFLIAKERPQFVCMKYIQAMTAVKISEALRFVNMVAAQDET